MSEYRQTSLSGRKSPLVGGYHSDISEEISQSGYLNRKCTLEPGGRKSRDRSWITLWCALKGTMMDFYRVEGVNVKPNNHPPPKDMFPPPSLKQSKFGFINVEEGAVDIDYTSQMNKDLQKRRQNLFQLILIDGTEYIFQAPAEKNRTAWVMALKRATTNAPAEEEAAPILAHSIKTSRDSIKQRSRQNVHSIKQQHTSVPVVVHGLSEEPVSELLEVPVAQSMASGDPNLRLLKKRLQAKRELLKQLKTMYTSFMGGSGALYADVLIHQESPSPEHTAEKEGVVHRRMSLPESKGQEEGDGKRSSTGDYCVSITTPLSPGIQSIDGVLETELLVDYHLVPGASWSLLKKGETVRVLGRASNGWYQCVALRDTTVNMEFDANGGYPLYSSLSPAVSDVSISSACNENGVDTVVGSEVNGVGSEIKGVRSEVNGVGSEGHERLRGKRNSEPIISPTQKVSSSLSDLTKREEELSVRKVSLPSPDPPPKASVGRTPSYLMATEEADDLFEETVVSRSLVPRNGRKKAATIGRSSSAITPSTHSRLRQKRDIKRRSETSSLYVPGRPTSPTPFRLLGLLEKEKGMGKYHAPLIGCVAPSALKCYAESVDSFSSSGDPQPESGLKNLEKSLSSSLPGEPEQPHSGEQIPELHVSSVPDSKQSTEKETESEGVVVEFEVVELNRPESIESIPDPPESEPVSPLKQETAREQTASPCDVTIEFENTSIPKPSPEADSSDDMSRPHAINVTGAVNRMSRAKSLPPPLIEHTPPPSPQHNGQTDESLMRSLSPTSINLKAKRGSLDTVSKSSRIKRFFKKNKKPGKGSQRPDSSTAHPLTASLTSPTHKKQRPHTISRKTKTLTPSSSRTLDDDFESSETRLRVASVSGRPVRREGVGLVIGGDSSSESEEENEEEEEEVAMPENQSDELVSSARSLEEKHIQVFDSLLAETNRISGMRRSASDHGSLALRANEVIQEGQELHPKSSQSLKRGLLPKMHSFKKPRANSEEVITYSPRRPGKRGKKRASDTYRPELGTPGTPETNTKWDVIFRAPPRGEKRYVYLDSTEGARSKYGFRLQSYGHIREQGKVLQTFVQSVVPGSVSFLAGLHPGDTIIEVNGVDMKYAPVENVVKAIQEGAQKMERIALKVEFVDGVTRLEGMKRSDDIKAKIKDKQAQLMKLIDQLQSTNTPPTPLASPQSPPTLTPISSLTSWGETTPTSKPRSHPFEYNRRLNSIVVVYQESIVNLQCDVLVMPLSSCHQPSSGTENVLLHLLKTGGEGLLDELSLAKQCRLGENIITGGHDLPASSIYHCVFGNLEESLQKCCVQALCDASSRGHRSIVFWLDGFASLSVSPQIIIESVRQWLGGNNSVLFDRVVFAAKANINMIENFLADSFPLEPFTQRDSVISEQGSVLSEESGIAVSVSESPNLEPENQNETSKLKKVEEIETREKSEDKTEDSDAVPSSVENVSPLFLSLSAEEEKEVDGDTLGNLPEIKTGTQQTLPLQDRTSVSDIGILLDLNSDDDDEDLEDRPINLRLSQSDSEDTPSLLKCLSEEAIKTEEAIITGGSGNSTPQISRSPKFGPTLVSRSVPTRGLVVLVNETNRSPSPGASPSALRKSPINLVLNPGREESDV